MKILIGLPVYKRDWILPTWFEAIEKQNFDLSEVGFIFLIGPDDSATVSKLMQWHETHPNVASFEIVVEENERHSAHDEQKNKRTWNHSQYYKMVTLRNLLLDEVVCLKPDRYLSLDSDIILENPDTLQTLYDLTETLDVVSPLSYMYPVGTGYPSVMTWQNRSGGLALRARTAYPIGTLFESDIVMAVKMMRPEVYEQVRYRWHRQGEDVGWSAECDRLGFKKFCASNIYCAHVMYPDLLSDYIKSGDPRSPLLLEEV